MMLYDGVFINNGGGKILQDYLIEKLEEAGMSVFYLLDKRVEKNHPVIDKNIVVYLVGDVWERHKFYLKNRNKFEKILCFGNIPPSCKVSGLVYTYFQQRLYIEQPNELKRLFRLILFYKIHVLKYFSRNNNFWIVQSLQMKQGLVKKLGFKEQEILTIPFYRSLAIDVPRKKTKTFFLYVSDGSEHKNHIRLLNAFKSVYDVRKSGELHLTISENFPYLIEKITELNSNGYPVINHGFVSQNELSTLYSIAEFVIYPSLSESFGLGIVEALEFGCKIIGANRPYLEAVCVPSLLFDPESETDIANAIEYALSENIVQSEQIVINEIERLLELLT